MRKTETKHGGAPQYRTRREKTKREATEENIPNVDDHLRPESRREEGGWPAKTRWPNVTPAVQKFAELKPYREARVIS